MSITALDSLLVDKCPGEARTASPALPLFALSGCSIQQAPALALPTGEQPLQKGFSQELPARAFEPVTLVRRVNLWRVILMWS